VKAALPVRERIAFREDSFAELVLWKLPSPLPGLPHAFKYRCAYGKAGVCLVRYDNEAGKGDHRHVRGSETVHADLKALYQAGVLDKTERGQVVFPYEAVRVEFLLQAA
jgi:hypothetical protein